MNVVPTAVRRVELIARALVPGVVAGMVLAGVQLDATFDEPPQFSRLSLLVYVAQVYILSEGIRWISHWLDRRLPWRGHMAARVLVQLAASLGFSCAYLLAVYVPTKLHEIAQGSNDVLSWTHIAFTGLLAMVFGLALSTLQLLFDFSRQWREAQVDAERQRLAALRAELDALKAQINPHFLFNSLNAVYGLIAQDPARARDLLLEVSDVFRYVLAHGHHDTVTLSQELDFLNSYTRVLHARHGGALRVLIDDLGDTGQVMVPPMSLQLLLENAVRHNHLDDADGLPVRIRREGSFLHISNPLRPRRSSTPGTGTGLKHVQARYRLLADANVEICNRGDEFRVSLPLLPCAS